jgi:Matrixin
MAQRALFQVDLLEQRENPTQFGSPWLNGDLTVSFVPDGTRLDSQRSDLFATMTASGLSETEWQGQVRRALQSWSSVTNLDFGVVSDSGDSIGTMGRFQRDTRFGDIRIAARPLNDTVLAITTPPSYIAETRTGDIIINSNYRFGINPAAGSGQYDLYTVMLQEVGHALGVGNSTDPNSVMYEVYGATRTGLGSGDISAVQNLYQGARAVDNFDKVLSNGSTKNASALPRFEGTTTLYAEGDVRTTSDVDVYSFTTLSSLPNGVTVRLNTKGKSLLAARVEILNSAGKVLASNATPTAEGDITLTLGSPAVNTRYFVRVTAPSGTGFGVGAYDLRVIYSPTAADPAAASAPTWVNDGGMNDSIATAVALVPVTPTSAQREYRAYGVIESSSDRDFHRIVAPTLAAGATTTLVLTLASRSATRLNIGGITQNITVFNAQGVEVPLEDLTQVGNRKIYQLRNVPSNAQYSVSVSYNGLLSDRSYELGATFHPQAIEFTQLDSVTLTSGSDTVEQTVVVNQAHVFSLSINSLAAGSGMPTLTYVELLNAAGTTVLSLFGAPNMNYGMAAFLEPGQYTLRYKAVFGTSSSAALNMTLRLTSLTDPIGLDGPMDPTADSSLELDGPFRLFVSDEDYFAFL